MPNGDPIEVNQFNFPGNKNHDKWYVCRGKGASTEYLSDNGNWFRATISGNFFWDTQSEANAAALPHRQKLGLC